MTVQRCIDEGLVGGDGFAADASLIKADANKQRSAAASEQVDWQALAASRRSVREYLDVLDDAAWGAASETQPKFVSRSDPASQWTGALKGLAIFLAMAAGSRTCLLLVSNFCLFASAAPPRPDAIVPDVMVD